MSEPNPEEKRQFSRIPFDSAVRMIKGNEQWNSTLLDISLKGALVSTPEGWNGSAGDACILEISLGADLDIRMETTVAHVENKQMGFCCERIDLASITHLRRIVELNTGDEQLLSRELHALSGK